MQAAWSALPGSQLPVISSESPCSGPQFLSIPSASIPEALRCSESCSIFFVQLPSELKFFVCLFVFHSTRSLHASLPSPTLHFS